MASAPRKEGYLLKKAVRSLFKDNWKKRWVVVDGTTSSLAYYKTSADKSPILSIELKASCTACTTDEHKRANELKVSTDSFTFFACAESEASRTEWIAALTAVINQHTPAKPVTLPPPPAVVPSIPAAPVSGPPPSTVSFGAAGTVAHASPTATPAPTFMKLSDLVRKAEDRVAKLMVVGANDVGQLGVGNLNNSGVSIPEEITALKVKQQPIGVSCGYRFGAAITASDQLFLWGENASSQLGVGAGMSRSTRPCLVTSLRTKRVLAVACGGSHTLAVVTEASTSGVLTLGPLPPGNPLHTGATGGVLYAWGGSMVGALGLGSDVPVTSTPSIVTIPGSGMVTYIAAGLCTSAAVLSGKSLFVWGDSSYGRLGLPIPEDDPIVWSPRLLRLGLEGCPEMLPQAVGLGGSCSAFLARPAEAPPGSLCVLLVSGLVGADVVPLQDKPGVVSSDDTVLEGGSVSVLLKKPQIGKDVFADVGPAVWAPMPTKALGGRACCIGIAAGASHYAVITREPAPPPKLSLLEAAKKAAGEAPAVAPSCLQVKLRGMVYTAGYGYLGHDQATISLERYVAVEPAPVGGALADEDVAEVVAGHYSTYARNVWGELFAWGANEFGGLNTGKYVDLPAPTACKEREGVHFEQIAAGPDFMFSLQYPGLLGDAKARQLAKNAFSKWRKKAAGRSATPSKDTKQLSAMLADIAQDEGLGEEMKGLGMDFSQLLAALLQANASAEVEHHAETAQVAPIGDALVPASAIRASVRLSRESATNNL